MLKVDNDIIELRDGNHIHYKDLLSKIATYLYVETSHETHTNNWVTYFEEIEEYFGLEEGFIDKDIANDIEGTLYEEFEKQIAEIEVYYNDGFDGSEVDRYFDITLYEDFCLGFVEDDQSIIENRGE